MFILKPGDDHKLYDINCHDAGIEFGYRDAHWMCVCDGCGEGNHSEIGSNLFCYHLLMTLEYNYVNGVREAIDFNVDKIGNFLDIPYIKNPLEVIRDYLSFTILVMEIRNKVAEFYYSGDGYVIIQKGGKLIYNKLSNSDKEYTDYYSNFKYKKYFPEGIDLSGSDLKYEEFSDFDKIGIATDGLRYIFEDKKIEEEFSKLLLEGKDFKVKRFINMNRSIFKDDICVIF